MRRIWTAGLAGLLALAASAGAGQGLLDRLRTGADKAMEAVDKGAKAVEGSIDSTVDLLSNEATPEDTRAKLDAMATNVLGRLLTQNAEASALFAQSHGYAVFDMRKLSLLPATAGVGRGVAVSRETGQRVYMNMGSGGVGLAVGIGGFESQVVILFETAADFQDFVTLGYEATAETGAVIGEDKTEQVVRFVDGRSFFVLDRKGWRVKATVGGTRYWADKSLN